MQGTFCDSSPVISELFYSQSASLIIPGLFPFRWFVPETALPLKTDGGSGEDNMLCYVFPLRPLTDPAEQHSAPAATKEKLPSIGCFCLALVLHRAHLCFLLQKSLDS